MGSAAVSGTQTRFLYDGGQIIGEYDAGGALLRRYVPGGGVDETILWYEGGADLSDRRWLVQDERGSVIAVSAGSCVSINAYDEYGSPGASNVGTFRIGSAWIP